MEKDILKKAFNFAREKHMGQLDDEGDEYFFAHLCPVVDILKQVTDDETILAAAYLHDTLEDTDTDFRDLVINFGNEVADLVLEVTHSGEKDQKGYYFPFLKTKNGILIKFADRLSNLSRMSGWDDKRQAQYLRKSKFWSSE